MNYMKVIQDANAYSFESTIDLTKNQKKIIKDVLNNCDIGDYFFLDIRPFLKKQYCLKICPSNEPKLIKHYRNVLICLTQVVCKTLAKDWIKIICPQKQAQFPYKSKQVPEWWPKDVAHIEPDHLDKESRIRLLLGILRHESVDLLQLRQSTNLIYFKMNSTTNLNYMSVQRLIYELFYVSLYERWILNYGIFENSELFNELNLSKEFQNRPVYLRVSNIDDTLLRTVSFKQTNYSTYDLELTKQSDLDSEDDEDNDDEKSYAKKKSKSSKATKIRGGRNSRIITKLKAKSTAKPAKTSEVVSKTENLPLEIGNGVHVCHRPSSIRRIIKTLSQEPSKKKESSKAVQPSTSTESNKKSKNVVAPKVTERSDDKAPKSPTDDVEPSRPIPSRHHSDSSVSIVKKEPNINDFTIPSSPSATVESNNYEHRFSHIPIRPDHGSDDMSDFKLHFGNDDISSSSRHSSSFYQTDTSSLIGSSQFSYSLPKHPRGDVYEYIYRVPEPMTDYDELLGI